MLPDNLSLETYLRYRSVGLITSILRDHFWLVGNPYLNLVTSELPVTRPGHSITSGLVDERGLSLKRLSVKRFLFGAQRLRGRYHACLQRGTECWDMCC